VLLQPLELFGPTALSALIAFVNAALAGLVLARLERRRAPLRFAAGAALALALSWVYGAVRMPQEQARSARAPKLTLGIVQADMGIWQKRRDPGEGRRRHIEQSLKLEREVRPQLIVWPETSLVSPVPATARSLAAELDPLRTPALVGAVAYAPQRTGGARLYNSAFLTGARGEVLGRSDKVRLIPFAEYIPLGETFPWLYDLSRGSGQLSAASAPRALEWGGRRIAVLICYEDVLAGFVRNVVRRTDPELLVDISNDAWFGHSREPAIHLALSTLRAIEHRRYLVRASNSGPSAVIDPLGRVVHATPPFERAELSAEVAWLSGQTLYARLGDLPGLVSLAVCGFVLLRRRRGLGPTGTAAS
jgi:apolipoprotein N-acyltransferase